MWSYLANTLNKLLFTDHGRRIFSLLGILAGVSILTFPTVTHASINVLINTLSTMGSFAGTAAGAVVDNIATRAILTAIGTFFISIAAMVLTLAGYLFNYLIDMTIVNFQGQLYISVQGGIERAWTVFRDIANILVIGMTVFIAISTILGVQEYNAKKLLSRVLIIAVLINFSLLFTKIIIDASNFTAKQFYDAMSIPGSTSTGNSGVGQFTNEGISGNFLQIMGVQSVTDTWKTINDAGGAAKNTGNFSGIINITIHSVLGTILLLAAAAVMLYGSFLMLSRALLMIFLLMTSSVAFASYLVPNLQAMGWDPWWSSLKRNAFFAPLFMLLLWASLQVARGLATPPAGSNQQTQSIGSLIHPSGSGSQSNVHALVVYLIVIGLLYGAIRISSRFANSIGGFSYSSGAIVHTARATQQVGSMALRNTLGRFANFKDSQGKARESAMAWQKRAANATGLKKQYYNLRSGLSEKLMQGYRKTAKSDFNVGGKLATGLQKAGFQPGNIAATQKGGYAGVVSTKAKAIIARAKDLTPTDDERKKIIDAERERMLNTNQDLKTQREAAASQAQQTKDTLAAAITEGLSKQAQHDKTVNDLETQHKNATAKMQEALEKAKTEPGKAVEHQKEADTQRTEAERLKQQITQARAQREIDLREAGQKITEAHDTAQRAVRDQNLFEGHLTDLATRNVHRQMGNGDEAKGKAIFERGTPEVSDQLADNLIATREYRESVAKAARKELGEAKKKDDNIKSILEAAGLGEKKADTPKAGTPAAAAKPTSTPKK